MFEKIKLNKPDQSQSSTYEVTPEESFQIKEYIYPDAEDTRYRTIHGFSVASGEKYFKLREENTHASAQFVVSKLLKGIVNVADVVEHDGEFYSREINLEHIRESTSLEKRMVGYVILRELFQDGDHDESQNNIKISDTGHMFFDFGFAHWAPDSQVRPVNLQKTIESVIVMNVEHTQIDRSKFKIYLQEVLVRLASQIDREFVSAIVNQIPEESLPPEFDNKTHMEQYLYAFTQNRISGMLSQLPDLQWPSDEAINQAIKLYNDEMD